VIAIVTMACGFTINIPVSDFKTGAVREEAISISETDGEVADVLIGFGAGELKINPGAEDALISGIATYNISDLKPKISVDGDRVRLETGNLEINGLPRFGKDLKNEWDLKLGDQPMDLTINAGAYQGDIDLGGLSLNSLEIADGAAEVRLRFSEPNQVAMDTLRYLTGASNVKMSGLANANFTSMTFRCGAGDYSLDFSGDLQRDAVVNIEAGISQVVIIVPEGTAAKVIFKGGLANVDVSGGWRSASGEYTLDGDGPTLIINFDMGAGNLELRTQ